MNERGGGGAEEYAYCEKATRFEISKSLLAIRLPEHDWTFIVHEIRVSLAILDILLSSFDE